MKYKKLLLRKNVQIGRMRKDGILRRYQGYRDGRKTGHRRNYDKGCCVTDSQLSNGGGIAGLKDNDGADAADRVNGEHQGGGTALVGESGSDVISDDESNEDCDDQSCFDCDSDADTTSKGKGIEERKDGTCLHVISNGNENRSDDNGNVCDGDSDCDGTIDHDNEAENVSSSIGDNDDESESDGSLICNKEDNRNEGLKDKQAACTDGDDSVKSNVTDDNDTMYNSDFPSEMCKRKIDVDINELNYTDPTGFVREVDTPRSRVVKHYSKGDDSEKNRDRWKSKALRGNDRILNILFGTDSHNVLTTNESSNGINGDAFSLEVAGDEQTNAGYKGGDNRCTSSNTRDSEIDREKDGRENITTWEGSRQVDADKEITVNSICSGGHLSNSCSRTGRLKDNEMEPRGHAYDLNHIAHFDGNDDGKLNISDSYSLDEGGSSSEREACSNPMFTVRHISVLDVLRKQECILRKRRASCISFNESNERQKNSTFHGKHRYYKTINEGSTKKHTGVRASSQPNNIKLLSKEERIRLCWREYLEQLNESSGSTFFSSKEARMEETKRVSKGKPAYAGLHINKENNFDVNEVYQMFYKSKSDVGGSAGAYSQFCCVVGQYLRFAVVCGAVDLGTVCDCGMTFEAVTNSDILVAFLNYFDVRATVSTVLTKALHLKKVLHFAKTYFRRAGSFEKVGKVEYCEEHVNSIFNSRKRLCRQQASRRRAVEDRISQGTILYPKDFQGCLANARKQLGGIQEWFKNHVRGIIESGETHESAVSKVAAVMDRKPELLQKWCVNFIALIVLSAGGQRPQVFPQLLCPEKESLDCFVKKTDDRGFCELPTGSEKTSRSLNVPFVVFPISVLQFIVFHCRFIHPLLVKKRCNIDPGHSTLREKQGKKNKRKGKKKGVLHVSEVREHGNKNLSKDTGSNSNCINTTEDEERFDTIENEAIFELNGFNDYLLLNTITGKCLTTYQVGAAFRRFLLNYDPNLGRITTKHIRPSYATMMFRGWLGGQIHKNKNELQFLQHMAMMMNTSVEQLKTTYISIDHGDYDKTVKGMVTAFTNMAEDDSSDSEDSIKNGKGDSSAGHFSSDLDMLHIGNETTARNEAARAKTRTREFGGSEPSVHDRSVRQKLQETNLEYKVQRRDSFFAETSVGSRTHSFSPQFSSAPTHSALKKSLRTTQNSSK